MGGNGGPNGAADEIKLIISRVQRLEEEISELKMDLKDVYQEAKSRGFDDKTIKRIVAYLKKDPEKRRSDAAMMELYLQAIGEGDGSLSDMARDFVDQKRSGKAPSDQLDAFNPPPEPKGGKPVDTDFGGDLEDKPINDEDAGVMGRDAARAGKPVSANPFRAGDTRRAAWDEAWCAALGSDGMDLPPELRPAEKPKKGGKGGDDAPAGDDDDNEGGDE